MRLLVKVIPLRAGTAESAGDLEVLACPPDVEADMILSFLTGRFGDLIETAWTSSGRHPRIEAGWIFPGPRDDERAVAWRSCACRASKPATGLPGRCLSGWLIGGRTSKSWPAAGCWIGTGSSNCPSATTGPRPARLGRDAAHNLRRPDR